MVASTRATWINIRVFLIGMTVSLTVMSAVFRAMEMVAVSTESPDYYCRTLWAFDHRLVEEALLSNCAGSRPLRHAFHSESPNSRCGKQFARKKVCTYS